MTQPPPKNLPQTRIARMPWRMLFQWMRGRRDGNYPMPMNADTHGGAANGGAADFYVTGGTLRMGDRSYVVRQADQDLYDGLAAGEFCYVLNARQMGKSSLMIRVARRLRDESGAAVVVLDLTAVGQNVTPEQWYDGLLAHVSEQLNLEDEMEDWWRDHSEIGPVQRFFASLRHVALPRIGDGRALVLFVDEIDAVRSLPFSADEFFAAVRESYNRRPEDAELRRLTFCLLGVATPSDLTRDTRVTPFNIGRRIELSDFTLREAAGLSEGIGGGRRGDALLRHILYWTNGHPYLTQRLCRTIALRPVPRTSRSEPPRQAVSRLCTDLFLSRQAREADDNLHFVRDRLLRCAATETDREALLDLYAQVRSGRKVEDDEADPRVSTLRLAGVVRSEGGRLRVRNRIYASVFDMGWVLQYLPGGETRRLRDAYRKGVFAAALAAAPALSILALWALWLHTANAVPDIPLPPAVTVPYPNAYTLFDLAERILPPTSETESEERGGTSPKGKPPFAITPEPTALRYVRWGLRYAYCEPQTESLDDAIAAPRRFQRLGALLHAEGQSLLAQGEWKAAADAGVDAFRLGAALRHGAGYDGMYAGRSCQADARDLLGAAMPHLDRPEHERIAGVLKDALRDEPTLAQIVQSEKRRRLALLLDLVCKPGWRDYYKQHALWINAALANIALPPANGDNSSASTKTSFPTLLSPPLVGPPLREFTRAFDLESSMAGAASGREADDFRVAAGRTGWFRRFLPDLLVNTLAEENKARAENQRLIDKLIF